ncbi:MAG: hypothetical protein OEY58_19370 [Gammaproteobacteria bacterium]|nr:hypothetical protein [Gammaproteobacteria bacterium]
MRKHSRFDFGVWSIVLVCGAVSMICAAFFLIKGLSSGSFGSATNVLIIGAIVLQVSEVILFLLASTDVLGQHSRLGRAGFFSLGCSLFLFSVFIMTMAQSTSLQTGVREAAANDSQRLRLEQQLESLTSIIDSYRKNADTQSQSVYANSRALGQDSINRAVELEQKKFAILEQLGQLDRSRKESSSDFFLRLESLTGIQQGYWGIAFLVTLSLLFEVIGIVLITTAVKLMSGYFSPDNDRLVFAADAVFEPAPRRSHPLALKPGPFPSGGERGMAHPPGVPPESSDAPSGTVLGREPAEGAVPPVLPAGKAQAPSGPDRRAVVEPSRMAQMNAARAKSRSGATVVPFGKSPVPDSDSALASDDDLVKKVLAAQQSGVLHGLSVRAIKKYLSTGSDRASRIRQLVLAAKSKKKKETES